VTPKSGKGKKDNFDFNEQQKLKILFSVKKTRSNGALIPLKLKDIW
jgi:hypothetical protein